MACMDLSHLTEKPHAICVPFPAQGHINAMLKLAKLLHSKGFHITFVNTEFTHGRLLKSRGPNSLNSLSSFRFEMIPDGIPPSESDNDAMPDALTTCDSTSKHCLAPFRDLLFKLNNSSNVPPVTCIVSDLNMNFTLTAAEEFGVPDVLFWTPSACSLMAVAQCPNLIQRGLMPLKDASYLTNGYLDKVIDWIPGMQGIRLRDLPTFIRTTNPDDFMVKFAMQLMEGAQRASAIVINTFAELEYDVLCPLSAIFPPIFAIGPLQLLSDQINDNRLECLGSNFWKEDSECLKWLDSKEPNSVLYVNFGSIAVLTSEQFFEFCWGLANSNQNFLWIIRPDLVTGDSAIILPDFSLATKDRGMLTSWCPQEQVLSHPSIGGFLTHNGWNSTIESISAGVPMICWPFFADQQTNCWYCCNKWGIGMEIDNDVKRNEVERLVRELLVGKKGKELKKKAMDWKREAERASSQVNLVDVINQVLSFNKIN
ncbi:hypothetical protein RJ639_008908 [Escallonia herrerae]|uniref:Glycosyltransferase n=1 Tax=Escallonia herrerae TaxID=1293975 RepID=A0AA88VSJ4_9ASTE|nr:hypothetical protein RJ639_008908 [Escallonia herrerae]